MLELPALGPYATLLLVLSIAGVISWGLTQILKVSLVRWKASHHDATWFNPLIRGFALLVGGAVGFLLMSSIVGAAVGAAGGILNSTIIMLVKSKLKGLNVETPQDDTSSPVVDPDKQE